MQTFIMKKEDEIIALKHELKEKISNQNEKQIDNDNSRVAELESQVRKLQEENESLVA